MKYQIIQAYNEEYSVYYVKLVDSEWRSYVASHLNSLILRIENISKEKDDFISDWIQSYKVMPYQKFENIKIIAEGNSLKELIEPFPYLFL